MKRTSWLAVFVVASVVRCGACGSGDAATSERGSTGSHTASATQPPPRPRRRPRRQHHHDRDARPRPAPRRPARPAQHDDAPARRTTTTTVAIPAAIGPLDLSAERVGLGLSAGGRPIVAERSGTVGGRRVLVIGVIHGDEDDGVAIIDELRAEPVPDGVELWIVESMNPDGQAAQEPRERQRRRPQPQLPVQLGPDRRARRLAVRGQSARRANPRPRRWSTS